MSEIRVDTISEKTSANGVAVDGVTLKDGGIAATAPSTFSSTGNTNNFKIISTDDGTSTAPDLQFYKNSSSPAANDFLGRVDFRGNDDAGNETNFITMFAQATSVANGSETAKFDINDAQGTSMLELSTTSGSASAVFNEDSADIDFRVESNGNDYMLFVDGGNNAICVGTDTHDTGPLVVQTGNSHATAMTVQSTGTTQLMLKDTDASSNDKYWGLQISGGDFNILTMDDDKASNFVTPLTINQSGAVIIPLQPAFLASPASQQSNLANNTTLLFGTEITDRNADFNGGNGTFTAPVTGLYQVGFSIRLQEVPINATYVMLETVTSNRSFFYILDPGVFDEDAAYWEFNGNYLIDMDANDTYFIRYIQSGGNTSTDMSTTSYSFGTLAC